jgi:hypothetical protein
MTFRAILLCELLLPGAVTALRKQVEANAALTDMHRHSNMVVGDPWCQVDHTSDMTKPLEQVMRENPGADMGCYFKKAAEIYARDPSHDGAIAYWMHPSSPAPMDYKAAALGGNTIKCADWKGDGTGEVITNAYLGGSISTHADCGFYAYDDFYFYSLGWLRGQGLDGRKLSNATAWEEQAANECKKMKEEIQPTPEETTLLYHCEQNGLIGLKVGCSLHPNCPNPITIRDFKLHVYTKCLLGGKRTFAEEMAIGYGRGCLFKEKNMIGHGVVCEHIPDGPPEHQPRHAKRRNRHTRGSHR